MNNQFRVQIGEALKKVEIILSKLPDGTTENFKQDISEFRRLLVDSRPPRFMLIGRRGSGKSSLINAIYGREVAQLGHVKSMTGQAKWFYFNEPTGDIEILDTRGLQEGSNPDETDQAVSPVESIKNAIKDKSPDIILFTIKAAEADAGIDNDLISLNDISNIIEITHKYRTPILVIATQCDAIEIKDVKLYAPHDEDPDEIKEKLNRIGQVENHLFKKVASYSDLKNQLISVIGVSAYMSWKKDQTLRSDQRWRIDQLMKLLFDELPKEGKMEFARISQIQAIQLTLANRLTSIVATLCAGIAAIPIPVADIFPLTTLQITLVTSIAYISGREFNQDQAIEFLKAIGATIGAGLVLREIARAAIKIIFPGGGSVISAGIAAAATMGIGKAAIAYFIFNSGEEEAKRIFTDERPSN